MKGQLHLIKCRCVLPQFKNKKDPINHQFVVFSIIDNNDNVKVKFSQCNNCGIIHKIIDICKSEIIPSKENLNSILSIDDIKTSLPSNLVDILERNQLDLPYWEQAKFIFENKKWGEFVLLAQEEEQSIKQGKYVRIMSETFFKVETFSREDIIQEQT